MRALLLLLAACEPHFAENLIGPWPSGIPADELDARALLESTPITLSGEIRGEDGVLAEVAVEALGQTTTTDANGRFSLSLPRRNANLTIEATGHRIERRPIHLVRALEETQVELLPILLTEMHEDEVRFFFMGDAALGRRFLDTDESTAWDKMPPDDPNALIQPSNALAGTRTIFNWFAPYVEIVDYPVANLETPILDRPITPHDGKPYVFFTLPESLEAFTEQGFSYLSLGNNHVYDYLELGLSDTLAHVADKGLFASGAGLTPDDAFLPHNTTLAGHNYSLLSMSSVSGFQYNVGFHATDTQGGSANVDDSRRTAAAIQGAWDNDHIPIVQLHTGREYMERPDPNSLDRFNRVASDGAALIVGHHPHFAQGFGYHHGILAAHSLGNFAFDQDRVETMIATTLQVDLRGDSVLGSRTLPIYLEDYRPRPLVGPLGDRILRRMAATSKDYGAWVVPDGPWGHISDDPNTVELIGHTAQVEVTFDALGIGVVDLRPLAPPLASLSSVRSEEVVDITLGRDTLLFGDFEDVDVDEQYLDFTRWDIEGDSRFPCVSRVHTGAVALCSIRDGTNRDPSISTFRHRVRMFGDPIDEPQKDLTIYGWTKGENAGELDVQIETRPSEGDAIFADDIVVTVEAGTYGWTPFQGHIQLPEDVATNGEADARQRNARAVWMRLHHQPPRDGRALIAIDDLAIITWFTNHRVDGVVTVPTPHPYDFIRVRGEPGETRILDLQFQELAWARPL